MSVLKTEAVVKVDGRRLPLEVQQILSITTSKEVNKIPLARITIRDGEVDRQGFSISDQNYFVPGAAVEILFGTPQEKIAVFKGIVTKHSIKVRRDKPSLLIVECKDETVRLSIGRKSRFFNDISDSDIFREIVREYPNLEVEAEDSDQIVVHPQIVQYFASDWDFISLRAEAIGYYLFVNDGKLTIRPPQLQAGPVFALAYGEPFDAPERSRIWEFESEIDARHQFNSVATSSWDFSKQSVVEGTNNLSIEESGNLSSDQLAGVIRLEDYQLHHLGRMLEGELTAFANAVKQKSLLNKSFGRIKFDGRGDLLPGDIVQLEGVGERFNGKVFVSRVHHSFEPGRWFTQIQFGLPYCWFHEKPEIANPPALGLLPPIAGLQIGKVVQLKDDGNADKDFRVKVSVPGFHRDEEGIWARLASPLAGNQRGLLFLPNIDDEVVIGYISEDAREPVVLGSLYSESAPPPLENDDNNYQKGLVTNNQHRIVIDEEKNTITIETNGGNKLLLDDQNGQIVLSKGQSTIEMTDTEVIIKATTIKLEAEATIDIKAAAAANINSPSGGVVKLGNGVTPAATVGTPINPVPPTPMVLAGGPNTKVLI